MDCACVYVSMNECLTEFCNERLVERARKTHTCGECRRQIEAGESYLYITGVWDGDFHAHKLCRDCQSVVEAFFCNGYMFERVWEDLGEHIREADGDLSESKVAGLTDAALAKVCDMVEQCWEE